MTSLGTTYYLMSWKGFDPEEKLWIPEDQVSDKQLIQIYHKKLKKGKNIDDEEPDNDLSEYYVKHRYQPFTIDIPSSH